MKTTHLLALAAAASLGLAACEKKSDSIPPTNPPAPKAENKEEPKKEAAKADAPKPAAPAPAAPTTDEVINAPTDSAPAPPPKPPEPAPKPPGQ